MNLASALFKRILEVEDFDTWSSLRKHYLPVEYAIIYDIIDKHVELYHKLPTISELKLSTRDSATLDKLYAIEVVEADAEPFLLLDYLKNEFAQKETLGHLHKFVENSISFETAEETVQSLYEIVAKIEDRVELDNGEDSMQKLSLFESDETISSYVKLGLNAEFDEMVRFKPIDYIMIGGPRGSGKSIVCANLSHNVYAQDKSVLHFTIEMDGRETIQRICSIATQIPHHKIKYKTLDNHEWLEVVKWWAHRFENSDRYIDFYREHRDFDKFHSLLVKESLKPAQLDIVYNPTLTMPQLRMESIKRAKKLGNVGLVVVDYMNQVKKSSVSDDVYDWKEQIQVSKGIKALAQELEIPFMSPYQIDSTGEARFAKGILDSADAAFTLTPGPNSIHFNCTKLRGDAMVSFTSETRWDTLTIGPNNGVEIQVEQKTRKAGKALNTPDPIIMDGIYD